MNSQMESLVTDSAAEHARRLRHLLGRLRFRHLQLLVTLQRVGSLHGAAQAMSLTQPSLSKALAEVESMFGCALFVRGPRGLRPTTEGALAIQSAGLLLAELEHLHRATLVAPAAVTIRLGVPPFVAGSHVPLLLDRLARQASGVRLQLHEGRVPALVQDLRSGQLDALISSYAAEIGEFASELVYEKLYDTELVVIAARRSSLARRRHVVWSALRSERWILPESASSVRRLVDEAFALSGLLAPEPWVESSNPVTNLRLVAAGHGISAVPVELLDDPAAAAHVARVNVATRLPRGPVALIHRRAVDHPRVRLLRESLGLAREQAPEVALGHARP